jgi:hypothetical protein
MISTSGAPASTRSPMRTHICRPTAWSTSSLARTRPAPRLSAALPTARLSTLATTPSRDAANISRSDANSSNSMSSVTRASPPCASIIAANFSSALPESNASVAVARAFSKS